MELKIKVVTALLCAAAVLAAGLWIFCRNYVSPAPELEGGADRVLFSGHMYALTNADKGRRLKANMTQENASLLVFGGDSISGDSRRHLNGRQFDQKLLEHQWNLFDESVRGVPGQPIAVPGNHDLLTRQGDRIQSEMRRSLSARNPFPTLYGKKVIGQCNVYFLNTFDATAATPSFQLDKEQLRWLLNGLDADLSSGSSCVVLFMHHRLWEMATYPSPLKGDPTQFAQIESRLVDFSTAIVCAGDLGKIESFRDGGIRFFNVSNMVGHSGYVRLDFSRTGVEITLVELGSQFRETMYVRFARLLERLGG